MKGKVRPEQQMWLTAFANGGAYARVVRPEDRDEVVAWVNGQIVVERLGA